MYIVDHMIVYALSPISFHFNLQHEIVCLNITNSRLSTRLYFHKFLGGSSH